MLIVAPVSNMHCSEGLGAAVEVGRVDELAWFSCAFVL